LKYEPDFLNWIWWNFSYHRAWWCTFRLQLDKYALTDDFSWFFSVSRDKYLLANPYLLIIHDHIPISFDPI